MQDVQHDIERFAQDTLGHREKDFAGKAEGNEHSADKAAQSAKSSAEKARAAQTVPTDPTSIAQ